ncbi:MAG: helix-turn-helix domain-containing protein, partial [Paracoccaceae bacterium]
HTWVSRAAVSSGPHVALVIWFHPDWAARVVADFVEFARIADLLSRAGRGLVFTPDVAAEVRAEFEGFFRLGASERLLSLMRMLDRLALDRAEPLASAPVHQDGLHESRERIDRVLRYIHANYAQGISMEALAGEAALSVSGLHRLFRKHTQGTVSAYVMALRIGEACARLSGTDQPVGSIADAVGYGAVANFNRQFLALKGMTPRQYRAHFRG